MSRITWNEFLTAISLILGVYYVIIVLLYYKKELQQLLLKPSNILQIYKEEQVTKNALISPRDAAEAIVQLIQKAATSRWTKQEIIFALQQLLNSPTCDQAKPSLPQAAIDQLIIDNCREYCSINLCEEDLHVLWI